MKSIILVLTINGVSQNAILKTNCDNNAQNFTIMQVQKPDGLSDDEFPFRYGDVYNIQDLLEKIAMLKAMEAFTLTGLYEEDHVGKKDLSSKLPVIKKVTITVTNEGATLKINGVAQSGLSWFDYLHAGESVTYSAELDGYDTDTDTLTVSSADITKSITLTQTQDNGNP